MPQLHGQHWGRLSPAVSVLSKQPWPHQARPRKLPKRSGNYSCSQHHALGGGISRLLPPPLHWPLGTSLVGPMAAPGMGTSRGAAVTRRDATGKKNACGKAMASRAQQCDSASRALQPCLPDPSHPWVQHGDQRRHPHFTAILSVSIHGGAGSGFGQRPQTLRSRCRGLLGLPPSAGPAVPLPKRQLSASLFVCKQADGDGSMC